MDNGSYDDWHLRDPASGAPGLSSDVLNQYHEVLMLIEIVPHDASLLDELSRWRPKSYREHFIASRLRQARAAVAAYDALPETRRAALDALFSTMDQLAMTAIRALVDAPLVADRIRLAEAVVGALRLLIDRASAALNRGGELPGGDQIHADAQVLVDRLISR